VKVADESVVKDQERELKKMFPDANYRQIMAFVRTGKAKKATLPGETNDKERDLMKNIEELCPYKEVDKKRVKDILKDDDQIEVFDFERDGIQGLNEEEFDKLVQERHIRADMDKEKQKTQTQIQQL